MNENTIVLTYMGRRLGRGDKVLYYYLTDDGQERAYSKRLGGVSVPGNVIRIEQSDDGQSVIPSSASWIATTEDRGAEAVEWAAQDEAVAEHLAEKSLVTKANKVSPLDDLLAQVSRVGSNLNRTERRALAAKLIEALYL